MGYDKVSRPLTDIVKLCNKKTHYIQEYYYDFYKEDKDTLVISFKLKGKEDFKYEFKK